MVIGYEMYLQTEEVFEQHRPIVAGDGDGGDAALICTIIMDGDKVVSLKSGPRPTCNFAYQGSRI